MSFDEAYELMGRDEAFRATIYAMNTLLTAKGIYKAEEFEKFFIEYAVTFQKKMDRQKNQAGTSHGVAHASL